MVPSYHGALVSWCPRIMVPSYHGALVSWCPRIMVPSYHGALVSWCPRIMVPSYHGALVSWCPRIMVPSYHGALVSWCPRIMVPSYHNPGIISCCHGSVGFGFQAPQRVGLRWCRMHLAVWRRAATGLAWSWRLVLQSPPGWRIWPAPLRCSSVLAAPRRFSSPASPRGGRAGVWSSCLC